MVPHKCNQDARLHICSLWKLGTSVSLLPLSFSHGCDSGSHMIWDAKTSQEQGMWERVMSYRNNKAHSAMSMAIQTGIGTG